MPKNVLVFPCGSEVGLEIRRALSGSSHFNLYGGSSTDDHGKFAYQNYISGLPFVQHPDFISELNKVIALYEIDFVIPAHDSAVLEMAENREQIKADIVTSDAQTCRITRSKRKTYDFFKGLIPTPTVFEPKEDLPFPVFLKPDVGQGSKGTLLASHQHEVDAHILKDPTTLILEYLPGREYTVDCFSDRKGRLLFCEGRERKRIYNGISVNSKERRDERFKKIAEIINEKLHLQGVWFYQVKERSNGGLVLMEIAPRIAGTMALFRMDGVNFAQLSLFDRMGVDVEIIRNGIDIEIDRALTQKYILNFEYDTVYVDFDDTLIINSMVNTVLMQFLYQSKNLSKKIVLITRHKQNIKDTLSQFWISETIFDEIIVLKGTERKSDYIRKQNSIFIDDSFSERKEVSQNAKIPVFSLDAVEALILDS